MKSISQRILIFFARYLRYYQYFHHFIIPFLKKKNDPKVFCIGYVRTGITSLYKALNILGYRSVHLLRGCFEPIEGWVEYIKKCNYDAYADYPMFEGDLYQKIDKAIPKSKFILTVRDKNSWVKSYANFFLDSPEGIKNSQVFKNRIQKFDDHNKNIISYFKDNPSQLLIMNIIEGDGWEKLCNFLNKPIPNKPFPHKNKGRYKQLD